MKILFTIVFSVFFIITSAIFFGVALILKICTFWFDKNLALLHSFTLFWASLYLKINPFWKINVYKNDIQIDNTKSHIFVSNHQSNFDTILLSVLNFNYKCVAKKELFKVPFIGWNMILNNYIPINRTSKKSIVDMMNQCDKAILKGNSVFLFPEGSRSIDGSIGKLKSGAFVLAKKHNLSIIPIVINGTKDIMPKNSKWINYKSNLSLSILNEVNSEMFNSVEVLKEYVQNIMAEELVKH